MRVCVLGSNSFSGSSFCLDALRRGYDLVGISRSVGSVSSLAPHTWFEGDRKINFFQLDINKNADQIVELIRGHDCEVVINYASQGMVAESWISPWDWYDTNVVGLSKLVKGLEGSSVKKFIHFSTPEVYGNTEGWIKESFDFNPTTPYAISRAAGDLHLKALSETFSFPVVFTRASNVYGEGQPLYRIIPRAIAAARIGQRLKLHGGGESVRNFIHIADVNRALFEIIHRGQLGATYHISGFECISIANLVHKILDACGCSFDSGVVEMVEERVGKDHAYLLDSQFLRDSLDWHDSVSLSDGISRVIAWFDDWVESPSFLDSMVYQHKR